MSVIDLKEYKVKSKAERKLDELGRITIPMEIRTLLGLEIHDKLEITLCEGIILMKKAEHRLEHDRHLKYLMNYAEESGRADVRKKVIELQEVLEERSKKL